MAQISDHAAQAVKNLRFLEQINGTVADCTDWQVTVCFYTAVHMISGHLAHFNIQHRSHHNVNDALNPQKRVSVSKLPENQYVAYVALQKLSRRSRYLVNENQVGSPDAALTHEKHLLRALKHLDVLLIFFKDKYGWDIPHIWVGCTDLKTDNDLKYMKVRR